MRTTQSFFSRKRLKPVVGIISAVCALCLSSGSYAEEAVASEPAVQPSFFQRSVGHAQDIILKGLQFVGVSYRRGGSSDAGLDCSGFVRLVFQDALGMTLPRSASEMSRVGENVKTAELQPGDLVFFNTMRRSNSHVGIYVGDNLFLHSPSPGGEVRVDDMRENYWTSRYNGARRVVE